MKLDSDIIKCLRFPLMLMVVFIHTKLTCFVDRHLYTIEEYPLFFNMEYICSELVPRIAVPLFFAFSGYLFFLKWNNSSTLTENIIPKLKKRAKTLLLPYISWNLIAIILFLLKDIFIPELSSGGRKSILDYTMTDFFAAFWNDDGTFPICFQFWFIRDLLVVMLASPIIYCIIKYLKQGGVILFLFIWLTGVHSPVGFSSISFLFFSIGAWFSINRKSFMSIVSKYGYIFIWLSFVLMILRLSIFNGVISIESKKLLELFYNIQILCTIPAFLHIVAMSIKSFAKIPEILQNANFFIYAFHAMPIALFCKVVTRYIAPQNELFIILLYFIIPSVIISIAAGLYALIKRYVPILLIPLTGGR